MKILQSPPMSEPTAAEIERLSVAFALHEMRRTGCPTSLIAFAEVHGRSEAVATWADLARVAILEVRALTGPVQDPSKTPFPTGPQSPQETGL